MRDLKDLLEQGANAAPRNDLPLSDLHDRRDRRRLRQRLQAGGLGMTVTVALVASAVLLPRGEGGSGPGARAVGDVLPAATTTAPEPGPGQFAFTKIHEWSTCRLDSCPGGDLQVNLQASLWWGSDGSGRIDATGNQNSGIQDGTFGPGELPTGGDTSLFPTDPAALEAFLLQRSASDGASPGPGEPTPTPGVDGRTGDVWRAIDDLLTSSEYPNTTPALRAALAEVAAGLPMTSVDANATDPVGRAAIRIRVNAFQMVEDLYIDPATHDLLAVVRTLDDGWTFTRVVEAAGVADSTSVEPNPSQSSIPPAPSS